MAFRALVLKNSVAHWMETPGWLKIVYLCLDPTPRDSDLTGMGSGLNTVSNQNSPGDCNVHQSVKTGL